MPYSSSEYARNRESKLSSIERRRRMARALADSQDSVGGMVSGYYVPNWGAALGNILKGAGAIYQNVKAGNEEDELKKFDADSEREKQAARASLLKNYPSNTAVMPNELEVNGEVQPIAMEKPTESQFVDWIGQAQEVDPELAKLGTDMFMTNMRGDQADARARAMIEWQMRKQQEAIDANMRAIQERGEQARQTKAVPTVKITEEPSPNKGPKLGNKEDQLLKVASKFDEMDALLSAYASPDATGGYSPVKGEVPGMSSFSNTAQQIPIIGPSIDRAVSGPEANKIRSGMMAITNQIRHSLFGSALTKTEAESFEKMLNSGTFRTQEELMSAFSRLRRSFYKDLQNQFSTMNREQLQYMHEGMAPGGAKMVIGGITGAPPAAIVPPTPAANSPQRPSVMTDEQRKKIFEQASGVNGL